MLDRIKALMAARQLSPSQFADQTTLPRPVVSHILSGRNKPSLEVVQKILAAYPDVAVDWLLNGRGPMLNTAVAATAHALPDPAPASTPPPPAGSAKRTGGQRVLRAAPAPGAPAEQPLEAVTAPADLPLAPTAPAPANSMPLMPPPPPAVQQVVRPERVVRRILVFYSDGSFSDHRPLAAEDNPFL